MNRDAGAHDRRIVVVTGASAGIGKAIARMFAARSWNVIGVGRDAVRSATAEAEIRAVAAPGTTIDFIRADFTSMAEVVTVAEQVKALTSRVDVLINNAGGVRDGRIVTAEGTEATFAANHLAPFLLTRKLMPLLKAAVPHRPPGAVRVIAVSSSGHRMADGMDWDDLQSLGSYAGALPYCRAKLANLLFTQELARRLAPDGIVAQAMHPGIVDSNFASHGDAAMRAHMAAAKTVKPDEAARTLLWLATSPDAGWPGGRYFHAMAEETPSEAARDKRAAERLWTASERLLASIGASA